jgi:hypothetical protein
MKNRLSSIQASRRIYHLTLGLKIGDIVENAISVILIAYIATIVMYALNSLIIIVSSMVNVSLETTSVHFPVLYVSFSLVRYTFLF